MLIVLLESLCFILKVILCVGKSLDQHDRDVMHFGLARNNYGYFYDTLSFFDEFRSACMIGEKESNLMKEFVDMVSKKKFFIYILMIS